MVPSRSAAGVLTRAVLVRAALSPPVPRRVRERRRRAESRRCVPSRPPCSSATRRARRLLGGRALGASCGPPSRPPRSSCRGGDAPRRVWWSASRTCRPPSGGVCRRWRCHLAGTHGTGLCLPRLSGRGCRRGGRARPPVRVPTARRDPLLLRPSGQARSGAPPDGDRLATPGRVADGDPSPTRHRARRAARAAVAGIGLVRTGSTWRTPTASSVSSTTDANTASSGAHCATSTRRRTSRPRVGGSCGSRSALCSTSLRGSHGRCGGR